MTLQINSVYSFDTYAPAILPATFKNARLEFSCNYETAMKFENVDVKYRQIYPILPPEAGAPEFPASVIFHRFITESGERWFVADCWIASASLVSVTNLNFTATIINASLQDKQNVAKALAHLGVNFSISDS